MAASHFKGYWSFRQNELPPQIKRESGGSLKKTIFKTYAIFLISRCMDILRYDQ